jgi:hypothetical protein
MKITKTFVQMEDTVTRCELAAQPKKELDWVCPHVQNFINNPYLLTDSTILFWSGLELHNW